MKLTRIYEKIKGLRPDQEDYPSAEELANRYPNITDPRLRKSKFEADWADEYRREEEDKRAGNEIVSQQKIQKRQIADKQNALETEVSNKNADDLRQAEETADSLHKELNDKTAARLTQMLGAAYAAKDDSLLKELVALIDKFPQYKTGSLFPEYQNKVYKYGEVDASKLPFIMAGNPESGEPYIINPKGSGHFNDEKFKKK